MGQGQFNAQSDKQGSGDFFQYATRRFSMLNFTGQTCRPVYQRQTPDTAGGEKNHPQNGKRYKNGFRVQIHKLGKKRKEKQGDLGVQKVCQQALPKQGPPPRVFNLHRLMFLCDPLPIQKSKTDPYQIPGSDVFNDIKCQCGRGQNRGKADGRKRCVYQYAGHYAKGRNDPGVSAMAMVRPRINTVS